MSLNSWLIKRQLIKANKRNVEALRAKRAQ